MGNRILLTCFGVSCIIAATASVGCGGGSSAPAASAPVAQAPAAVRSYSATASVGDFLSISIDSNASTLTYANHTNNTSGTLAYTVGSDGAYNITTPNAGLLKAYEIPGFALVASANNTGPQANTSSLVTAILQGPVSQSSIANQNFNYMQWRTSNGGMEIGTISIDGSGNVAHTGYFPMGAMQKQIGAGQSPDVFGGGTFAASSFTGDPSGNFMSLTENGETETIFGTQGGFFVVDLTNGSLISVPQAGSTALAAGTPGTYRALAYTKLNATLAPGGNSETGTGSVSAYTFLISSLGLLTVVDANGNTVTSNQALTPVANTAYLQGAGALPNTCPGMFTFRVTKGTVQQDVYLEFIKSGILFCSYSYNTAQSPLSTLAYSYFYGVALQQ